MGFEFLTDLDEYFCEKYANYDKLCVLPGYRMPKMQESRMEITGYRTARRTYSTVFPQRVHLLAETRAQPLS